MAELMCRLLGHRWVAFETRRGPVYADRCQRCGVKPGRREYRPRRGDPAKGMRGRG